MTKHSKKLSYEMIKSMVYLFYSENSLDLHIYSKNMSEVPIGVLNSCEIVEVKL